MLEIGCDKIIRILWYANLERHIRNLLSIDVDGDLIYSIIHYCDKIIPSKKDNHYSVGGWICRGLSRTL